MAAGKLITSIILWDGVPVCLTCVSRCSDEDIGRQTLIEPVCDPGDGVQCEICADWHHDDGLILSHEEKSYRPRYLPDDGRDDPVDDVWDDRDSDAAADRYERWITREPR